MWKLLAVTLLLIASAAGAFILYVRNAPTITDAQASSAVCNEFVQEAQNLGVPLGKTDVQFTPRRGRTILVIGVALDDRTKVNLRMIAQQISVKHGGRNISLTFW